ncbi:OmpA family protein [Flammeovirga sp. SubArs3]|uniref:OmpA family protein n=1 Tax=Flammeovirga sp. SubArs3 TaxID=2995316 RepID=UPI00248AB5F3|nr:OmpA family protein [Flammeovirga sp. SubArs3]
MHKYYFSTLLFLILSVTSFAQNIPFDKTHYPDQKKELRNALMNIDIADAYRQQYHKYDSALKYYYLANNFNDRNAVLNQKIGITFSLLEQLDSADIYLCTSLSLDKNNLRSIFIAADIAHKNQNWDKAIELYERYINEYDNIAFPTKKEVNVLLQQAKNRKVDNKNVDIINLEELNSRYNELNPLLLPNTNQIFFTSNQPSKNSVLSKVDGSYFQNIFYYNYDKNDSASVKIVDNSIINPEGNSSVSSISKSGKTMVIYHGFNTGVVYYSRFKDFNGESLPYNKTKMPNPINSYFHQQGEGTFTPDGKGFYFSAKRDKKQKHYDLYYTTREGKKWKTPQPLSTINSSFDEIAPYFSNNGDTLFFASNSEKSIGGYDIFYSVLKNNNWSSPQTLPAPINSPFDEVFYSADTTGETVYISSNRIGGKGGYDIYKISPKVEEMVSEELNDVFDHQLMYAQLTIIDIDTKMPLSGVQLQLYNSENNSLLRNKISDQRGIVQLVDLPKNVSLGGNLIKKGYKFFSRNFIITEDSALRVIELESIKMDQKVELENIFFDTNSSVIKENSFSELNALLNFLQLNPSINIQIEGHTDNTGTDNGNIQLSNDRASAILRYLEQNGIQANRLTSKGFGDSMPIADNSTEEGKAQNRRTEFKIIKTN